MSDSSDDSDDSRPPLWLELLLLAGVFVTGLMFGGAVVLNLWMRESLERMTGVLP